MNNMIECKKKKRLYLNLKIKAQSLLMWVIYP